MLKAIVLEDKDIKKYNDILDLVIDGELYSTDSFDKEGFLEDCDQLRATSEGNTIEIDNRGFTAEVTLERENLVFYSVPYDEGWSVTVDGKQTEIVKANVGFMAVRVPEGTHTIRFNYKTPGMTAGWIISLCGFAVLAVYLLLFRAWRKKHPECMTAINPELEQAQAQWAIYDIAESAYAGHLTSPVDPPEKETPPEPEQENETTEGDENNE